MPVHMGWHQPWWQRGDGSPGQRVGCESCGSPGEGAGAWGRRGGGAEMLEEPAAFPPHP